MSQMLTTTGAELTPGARYFFSSSTWMKGLKDMSHPPLLSKAINRELDSKLSSWDSNRCPYEILALFRWKINLTYLYTGSQMILILMAVTIAHTTTHNKHVEMSLRFDCALVSHLQLCHGLWIDCLPLDLGITRIGPLFYMSLFLPPSVIILLIGNPVGFTCLGLLSVFSFSAVYPY